MPKVRYYGSMKKLYSIFGILFVWSTAVFGSPVAEHVRAEQRTTLSILGTTDVHGNIWGFSYEDDRETTNSGFARIASYVDSVRTENPHTIVLDNGDTYQGTIMTDDLYNKQDLPHPVTAAMNTIGYTAMTLGNHEFNFGKQLVDRIVRDAQFAVLAANLHLADGSHYTDAATIVNVGGINVGIIGLTNPDAPRWDGEKVDPFKFDAVGPAARKAIDQIKDNVDVLVVTAHVGLFPEYDEEYGSDGANAILALCPEIDILLLGHAHIMLNQTTGKTLVGAVPNGGRYVVRFDLTIDGNKKIVDRSLSIVDMQAYEPSVAIRAHPLIKEAHERTRNFISGGSFDSESSSEGGIFGIASVNFQPENEIRGIPQGKIVDSAVVDLINTVQLLNSGADVSAAALFQDNSDIKAGPINYGTVFNIYKFDNTLYTVEVTGAELKAFMEWSAEHYNQWKPGDISISFNEDVPGYRYDMFAGVDYEIDLSKPSGERIINVQYEGKPLEDEQKLILAVNNYRYSSGLKAFNLVSGTRNWESPNSIRDMLVAYIKEKGTLTPEVDNNWRIVGIDLESPYREEIINKVNAEELDIPYNAALNIEELKAAGIIQ
ncbi:2',3'-cyclic-nucleotide 2'-phosphodiesterase / 3'-nucleotidase [Pillotina sp. SPG140]